MPIYEYECEKCGHVFEAIQKVDARPLRQCEREKCKGKVHRLVSSPAIQFKGTGWYVTDYARKGAGSGEATKGSDSDSSEKGSSKKSETSKKAGSSSKSDASTKAGKKTKSS